MQSFKVSYIIDEMEVCCNIHKLWYFCPWNKAFIYMGGNCISSQQKETE